MTDAPAQILTDHGIPWDWHVILAYRGSIAHGMHTSSGAESIDDRDTVGVVVPTVEHYLGLDEFGSRGTREIKAGEWDCVTYEMRKTVRMLRQGNPNILSLLWLPDEMFLKRTTAGDLLIAHRSLFAGRWCLDPFVGYARGQLTKMRSCTGLGYLGAKRKALVERHGFDAKNAGHVIRLLRMACELFETGELTVDRSGIDAEELLSIKRGGWSLEHVEREAGHLFRLAEEAHDRSSLPDRPDAEAISELCSNAVRTALQHRNEL